METEIKELKSKLDMQSDNMAKELASLIDVIIKLANNLDVIVAKMNVVAADMQ